MDKNPANLSGINGGGSLSGNITKSTQFNIVVKPNLPLDKSFSELTDEEFLQISQALQSGIITTSEVPWNVGDERNINIVSFLAYADRTSAASGTTETVPAKTNKLIILNKGGKKFYDGKNCNFIIGFKYSPCDSDWNNKYIIKYEDSHIWKTEDNLYNALPNEIKLAFKPFICTTFDKYSYKIEDYQRLIASPAEAEVFGACADGEQVEFDALTANSQFNFYKTQSNRQLDGGLSWYLRSPGRYSQTVVCINNLGASGAQGANGCLAIRPFGCI